jgi:hypothetical protein
MGSYPHFIGIAGSLCAGSAATERPHVESCLRAVAIALTLASVAPAVAQQVRAGLLTCDVSAGLGLIITSQKQLSCEFMPARPGLIREDYDGSITKFGLDLGISGGGVMVWAVFTGTVAGPGFLAGDYVGASGEASLGAGLGANVLVGDSTGR